MYNKLDLVRVHINSKRHTLSKWLSVSFNDLVLLSGHEISTDKTLYNITYRKEGCHAFDFLENNDDYIWPEQGMEIFVQETNI